MKVTDYIKTGETYTWNWETIKKLDGDWVELQLRDKTRICGWLQYVAVANSRYGKVYITNRFDTPVLILTPDMLDTETIDEYPHVIIPTGIFGTEDEEESEYALEKYSDLVIKKEIKEFIKDKFIEDFSTLIANMVTLKAFKKDISMIIRFTGRVLNNDDYLTFLNALDDYPDVPRIFDKYFEHPVVSYCINNLVTSHYFKTGDGYFDAVTAFKYLLDGKKVRQVDWTPDEYIKLCRYRDSIIDENNEEVNLNIVLYGRDVEWELFKED